MSEAVDPALMTPSSAAEKRLQQQLEVGGQAALGLDSKALETCICAPRVHLVFHLLVICKQVICTQDYEGCC